jgi:hypothetical protein
MGVFFSISIHQYSPEGVNVKTKIAIASIARNVSDTFHLDLKRFMTAFSDYEIVKWIIVESNSTDGSPLVLEEYSKEYKFIYTESINSSDKHYPQRTQKLAHARNRYLKIFDELQETQKVDYLVVCDLNNLNNKLTKKAVASCAKISNWGALTANQNGPYYDIWALRHRHWNDADCWKRYEDLIQFYPNKYLALWDSVYSKMIKIHPDKAPIQVDSAFGGLAIYKVEYLYKCIYVGTNENNQQICEHISFHEQFTKNGGDIYINPALINLKFTDHSLRKKYFAYFNLKYLIRQIMP